MSKYRHSEKFVSQSPLCNASFPEHNLGNSTGCWLLLVRLSAEVGCPQCSLNAACHEEKLVFFFFSSVQLCLADFINIALLQLLLLFIVIIYL